MTERAKKAVNNVANTQQQPTVPSVPPAGPIQLAPRHGRRASIASTTLFSVGQMVRDVGFDYLQKIPRSNQVVLGGANSNNDDKVVPTSAKAGDVPEQQNAGNSSGEENAASRVAEIGT